MSAVKLINFEHFYNELEVQEQIPLRKLLAKLPTWFGEKGVEFHLDFDGIEQLTDEVFHLLETSVPDEARVRVARVSCAGCRHLRDDGMAHLARAFPRLQQLNLDGCRLLTERSLHYLGKHCRDLKSVSMLGTGLTHCGSRQLGFQVLSDPACQFIDGPVSTIARLPVKLAIICDPAVTVSIGALALPGAVGGAQPSSSSKSRPSSSKSAVTSSVQPPPTFRALSATVGDLDLTVFEMRADLVYSSLFMSNTAGFVLVVDAERTENPQLEIMRMIDAVRGAVFEAPLLLVATVSSQKGVENVASLKSDLENMLRDQVDNMKEHLEKEHLNSCYDKDFPHQWRYVQSIQCADVTHFPITLVAVPVEGFNEDWVFETTLREVKVDSNVQAQVQYWAEHDYMFAIDALDRCTKADFMELRSLSAPPPVVVTTMKCVMLIFDIPFTEDDAWPTAKNLVSETRFLLRFKDTNYITESLSGRHAKLLADLTALVPEWETFGETVKRWFNIINCMWLYVYAVIKYLLLVKEHERELNPAGAAVAESAGIEKEGKLLFFPEGTNQPVVLDLAWFMSCLAHLDAIADYRNGDSCWTLGRNVPALSEAELRAELLAAGATEDEAETLRRILLRFGLLGHTDTVRESTQAGRVARLQHAAEASSRRYFLWSRLEPRVSIRFSATEEKLSMRHHKSMYMPDLQSEDFPPGDICLLFSVKFRVGFPANLLARFATACMQSPVATGVVQVWRTGMHVQRGVCDILCTYGLHSTLASSSIDFECRMNETVPGANSDSLKEYIWSCFSDLLTTLESVAAEYPYLHHKLRVYCRGECFHSGLKNTFSVPEVGRTLANHKSCSKCRAKQMTDAEWRFMWYRLAPFPQHDWIDRYQNSFSCEHCFLWKKTVAKMWRHFCRVYPTFASKAFDVVSGLPASLQGNLLVAASRPRFDEEKSSDQPVTLETLLRSRLPMRHASFDHLEVSFLHRPGCEQAVWLALHDDASEDAIIGLTLRDRQLKFSLKKSALHDWEFVRQLKDDSLPADEPITDVVLRITGCCYNDHYDCYFNQLEVSINSEVLLRAPITDQLYAFVRARYPLEEQEPSSESRNLAILGCPQFAHVSTLHFHPGMLLLFRTGVGQTWLPGVVTSIRDGLLEVAPPEDLQHGRLFAVDSDDIRPLGFYPEEINAVVDKKQLKGFDQWYDYLSAYPTYLPVPFGNFQYLDSQYTPLPIRHKQSRRCTSSVNSPYSLTAGLTVKWNPARNAGYFVLLPGTLKSEDIFIAPRIKMQSPKDQRLHFLCRGLQWSANTSDMHLLDKQGVELSEDEYRYVVKHYDTNLIYLIGMLLRFTSFLSKADLAYLPGIDSELGVNQGIWPVLRSYRDQLLLKRMLEQDGYKESSLCAKTGPVARVRSGRADARPESASGNGLRIAQMLHSHSRDLCDSHTAAKTVLTQDDLGRHVDCLRNIRAKNQVLPQPFPNAALLSAANLTNLELSRCKMRDTGWLSQMSEGLINLQLHENFITKLDPSLSRLKRLKFLNLSYNPISYLPTFAWSEYRNHGFAVQKALKGIGEELFARHDVNNDKILQAQELQNFLAELFAVVPRLCVEDGGGPSEAEFPMELLGCRSLESLVLSNQGIRRVPQEISALKQLRTLVLDNNLYLESVQGNLPELKVLSMQGCENLKTPPQEILAQGMMATIAYLRRLASGSVACYRTKLMFVGLGGAGKTSLMRALMSPDFKAPQIRLEAITDGIDISTWTINRSGQSVTFSVWDFAGQTLYYNTHQFFLTARAVYLLVWNMRLGFEHAGLDFWMNSISCHAPGVPIFVVGTHCDKVAKFDMPVQDLKDKYPGIVGFFSVSSASGEGVEQLLKQILETTLSQPYIGEHVPEAWLNFEKAIISNRSSNSLLKWSEWLVDVMACVVTVHNHVIKEGRFKHEDIHTIWKDYPAQLHDWLLTLTETFDLTFPLTDSGVSVVPCLLPQKKPQFDWDDVTALGDIQEAKMKYTFDYLPAGLFNRAQVRLCQFSDDLVIWQRGSLLCKGDHRALMVKKGERTVIVKVQGSSPENMLMLIHEVFEGLIAEAFGGVSYVYEVPCIDCVRQKIQEPAMFSSQVLRRAIEMRALFLQCHSMFHCVPIPTLQAVMPPESPADFELHFERSVNDLSAARLDLVHDVTLIFCCANKSGGGGDIIEKIQAGLETAGLSVQCVSDEATSEERSLSDSMALLQQSGCCLCLISNEFVLSDTCAQYLSLATEHLKKPLVLGLVGSGKDWQQTALGARLSGLVYINFQREAQFDAKLAEAVAAVREKSGAGKRERVSGRADVFISYCWANSQEAVKAGHGKATSRSIGFGDPRKLKKHLEEAGGLSCWIDIERLGENGMFEDLCQGLKACKLVVACLSDEYVASKNCQMEYRFAHLTLNRPMVICVVGTGVLWEST
uniref:non-specific serine/threonine protein kinase n=2 Tax=Macrostomum lignano TaxID=282301 RepID=A0A1I8J1V0_9PLAT